MKSRSVIYLRQAKTQVIVKITDNIHVSFKSAINLLTGLV